MFLSLKNVYHTEIYSIYPDMMKDNFIEKVIKNQETNVLFFLQESVLLIKETREKCIYFFYEKVLNYRLFF